MAQTTTKKLSVFPGNLVPGAALAAEYWQVSNATGAAATTVDLTFDLVNGYDQIPAIAGTPLLTKGGGPRPTRSWRGTSRRRPNHRSS